MFSDRTSEQLEIAQENLIRIQLPDFLSKLVLAGQEKEALRLLIAWGTQKTEERLIWIEAKALLER